MNDDQYFEPAEMKEGQPGPKGGDQQPNQEGGRDGQGTQQGGNKGDNDGKGSGSN